MGLVGKLNYQNSENLEGLVNRIYRKPEIIGWQFKSKLPKILTDDTCSALLSNDIFRGYLVF